MDSSTLLSVRLYFNHSARAKPTKFWHRLSAPGLGHHLIHVARKAGIHQALLHSVHVGYLSGNKITHRHIESTPSNHPMCIELIDTEHKLKKFIHDHSEELQNVKVVLFRGEVLN